MSTLRRTLPAAAALSALLLLPRPGAAVAPIPTVFLNHFFVVISPQSYAAILADPYLTTTFAPFEKRTTARNDQPTPALTGTAGKPTSRFSSRPLKDPSERAESPSASMAWVNRPR